ncbi:MAG: hypothetical protein ACI9GM_000843, partial [Salibacteraceae bacterium]
MVLAQGNFRKNLRDDFTDWLFWKQLISIKSP